MEASLGMQNLRKTTDTTDTRTTSQIKEMEERISSIDDTIGDIDTPIKETDKRKKFLTQNIQKI
jgi:peptidoglycan hydrolase CwlO-like protein